LLVYPVCVLTSPPLLTAANFSCAGRGTPSACNRHTWYDFGTTTTSYIRTHPFSQTRLPDAYDRRIPSVDQLRISLRLGATQPEEVGSTSWAARCCTAGWLQVIADAERVLFRTLSVTILDCHLARRSIRRPGHKRVPHESIALVLKWHGRVVARLRVLCRRRCFWLGYRRRGCDS